MPRLELEFELERETKNTFRYAEVTEGQPPVVGTIYIQKWKIGKNPPANIRVMVEW